MSKEIVMLSLILLSCVSSAVCLNDYELDIMHFLGLSHRAVHLKKQPSLQNSASKFLLNIYNELHQHDEAEATLFRKRYKRNLNYDDNFITELDRQKVDACNNIITFFSKIPKDAANEINTTNADIHMVFNTNDVSRELRLEHSSLRFYQDPSLGRYKDHQLANTSISIYQRIYSRQQPHKFKIISTINTTTLYRGWLQFNVTSLLSKWLQHRSLHQVIYDNEIMMSACRYANAESGDVRRYKVAPRDLGVVSPYNDIEDLQPFITAYFNGPEPLEKLQKLRFKRELVKSKRNAYMQRQFLAAEYKHPEICQRLSLTFDFKYLAMRDTVIAPKQFEAYFCGGSCNFPLGSKMNATNHAIVQTLMHFRQPDLPKACCVPTKLESISILYNESEDSVKLGKYPYIVAKECGCH